MKKASWCKTAAAVAIGLASLAAQAAEVVLSFEGLRASILAGNGGAGLPVAVGASQSGFQFSGAYAYDFGVLSAADSDPTPDAAQISGSVFIANQNRGAMPGVIELSLVGSNATRAFKTLSFDYFVGQSEPTIEVLGATGLLHTFTFTLGSGPKPWQSSANLDLLGFTGANRLRFSGSNAGLLGLDNISIDFVSGRTGGGGTVPEPASFALVALALLGAGAASRRRNSH